MVAEVVANEEPARADGAQHIDTIQLLKDYALKVPTQDSTRYQIPEIHLGARRPIKVLIIGFGAAAINIAHAIGQLKGSNIVIQCYEKNGEIGGTWYENR
jgi:hypothetical protein